MRVSEHMCCCETYAVTGYCCELLQEQRHQQDLLRHQMESELQQQQHHHQLKLLQKMHNKKEASSVSGGTSTSATDASAAKGSQSRRETLTSKLQHHQSKLAQALMGQDGLITTSPALLGSPLFKGAELALDQQLTSTEYDSSIRTDSGQLLIIIIIIITMTIYNWRHNTAMPLRGCLTVNKQRNMPC